MLLAGCFVYRPATPAQLRPGDVTAVALSTEGAAALTPRLGPRAEQVNGRVLASADSAVTLAVTSVVRRSLQPETWPGDAVPVPVAAAERWQVRRFSGRRTALLAAASLAAGVLTRSALLEAGIGRGRTGGTSGGR